MYLQLSTVAHNYNPSNSGGKDQEDCSSGQSKQKISKTPTSTEKLGVVTHTCHPSYVGSLSWWWILIQAGLKKKKTTRFHLRNN
jgi:hypothetical protein